jgi:chromosome segregation ATPase
MMKTSSAAIAAAAAVALLATALPALAQTDSTASANIAASTMLPGAGAATSTAKNSSGASARTDVKTRATTVTIDSARTRADQEIARRVSALNALLTRLSSAKRVSADEKSALTASIQGQIQTLTALKAKIDAETDLNDLKSDIKSITASYRIYMLVIPQGLIEASADRVSTIASQLTALSAKIDARLSQLASAGKDVSAQQSALADLNAKAADAQARASAALSLIADLSPDNGDAALAQQNKTALQNARADIKAATSAIKAAYKDAQSIRTGIASLEGSAHANASASAVVQ